MRVAAFDPSLRNWGWSKGFFHPKTGHLSVDTVGVIQPVLPKGKQVRVNSLDLMSAEQLADQAWEVAQDAQVVFVEGPVGSQSARAMASYGICVGVLGALRARGMSFMELDPTAIKLVTGKKTATKKEMIDWATSNYPFVGWPTQTKKGITSYVESSTEHMADATAAMYAGVNSQQFKQFVQMHKGMS